MLTIKGFAASDPSKIIAYAEGRSEQRGGREDYYAQNAAVGFGGRAASALGLGDYNRDNMFKLLAGYDHQGNQLVGGRADKRRPGWDFCFSAPKSVSAVWAVAKQGEAAQIEAAQNEAAQLAMSWVERQLQARRGKNGMDKEQVAGAVWASYQHGTNREMEPGLHNHIILANLAMRQDGTWGAVEPRKAYQAQMAAGAIYRSHLAAKLNELGYITEADGSSFKIYGVSDEVCAAWSTRHSQVVEAKEQQGLSGRAAARAAALATRKKKDKDVDPDELRQSWREQAAAMGLTSATVDQIKGKQPQPEAELDPTEVMEQVTSNKSVATDHDIWRAVATQGQIRGWDATEIERQVKRVTSSNHCLLLHQDQNRTLYTSWDLAKKERAVLAGWQALALDQSRQVTDRQMFVGIKKFEENKGFKLSGEQLDAVKHVCRDSGAAAAIIGDPGSGKSTLLGACREVWGQAGQEVRGCALAAKAAKELEKSSGIKSSTIHDLLQNPEKIKKNTVLVIDEASMVDSRQMHDLVNMVGNSHGKIVLAGDDKQLQAVGAGGVYNHICDQYQTARLSDNRRQQGDLHKKAIKDVIDNKIEDALKYYIDNNNLSIADDREHGIDLVCDKYLDDPQKDKTIIANTNRDVDNINHKIRDALQLDNRLGTEYSFKMDDKGVEKDICLATNDKIIFKRNNRKFGVKNGELGTVKGFDVTETGKQIIKIEKDNGDLVAIDPDQYKHIKHGYAITTTASQGLTTDNVINFVSGDMQTKEATLVGLSRARKQTEIVATADLADDLQDRSIYRQIIYGEMPTDLEQEQGQGKQATDQLERIKNIVKQMSRTNQKDLTIDYPSQSPERQERQRQQQQRQQSRGREVGLEL